MNEKKNRSKRIYSGERNNETGMLVNSVIFRNHNLIYYLFSGSVFH